jgi:hypothetical protein
MTHPHEPTPPDPLSPEERVLQMKGRIGAEQSIAQAKKMVLRLLIGGLVLGIFSSIVVVKLIALLDRTFETDMAPPRSPNTQQSQ